MKVLVTGVNGQLGHDVIERLTIQGVTCQGVDINDFSLTNEAAAKAYISDYEPQVIIHCAAYTAVDKAEDEQEVSYNVNVLGTKYMAEAAKELGAKMVYISTDYIFPGDGDHYYTEEDQARPINHYGMTKWQGEQVVRELVKAHFILRISWAFGVSGNNFIKTMLKLGETKKELKVVDDQIGSPTYTYDLAILIAKMIQTDQYGTYHATNTGICSWYEFAQEIFKLADIPMTVIPVGSEAYPVKATRPHNSRLSKAKLEQAGFEPLPKWQDALKRYLKALS